MMTRRTTTPSSVAPHGSTQRYRDRIYDDPRHDPYQAKGKYTEPVVCGGCRAIFQHGRWVWGEAPEGARREECPACHRVRDQQPAGYLTLAGALADADRGELERLARNVEKRESAEHPLHRIIAIEQGPEATLITTTDIHLPQKIGEAVRHSHKGTLDIVYGQDEYTVRVHWTK